MSAPPLAVLLVEDNPADARGIRELLADASKVSMDVAVEERLGSALTRLERERFDVVLLDLCLPDSQGIDTVTRLHAGAPHVPLVTLTGLSDADVERRALQEGAQDYVLKQGLDGESLLTAMRHAVERQRWQKPPSSVALADELTGVFNRSAFLMLAQREMRLARRTGAGFVLLFVRLCDLDRVLADFGHEASEAALCAAAGILRAAFRATDVVGRVEHDSFAVLAAAAGEGALPGLEERVHRSVARFNETSRQSWRLGLRLATEVWRSESVESLDQLLAGGLSRLPVGTETARAPAGGPAVEANGGEGAAGAGPAADGEPIVLRLFVSGTSARSRAAAASLQHIADDERLRGRCRVEKIDTREDPVAATRDAVLVTPALLRVAPGPERRVVGDLSDTAAVLRALDLVGHGPEGSVSGVGR
jgi:two-component system cell cycle response regulator